MSTTPESDNDSPPAAPPAVSAAAVPAAPEVAAVPKIATAESRSGRKRVLQGIVVSDKMEKTIVVAIHRRKLHRLYKKYINRTKRVKAHDAANTAKEGDTVRVEECRPLSREKHWRLLEIVTRAT